MFKGKSAVVRNRRRMAQAVVEALESRQLLSGTEYLVNSLADTVAADDLLTLREATQAANTDIAINEAPAGSSSETDVIRFDPELFANGPAELVLAGTELLVRGSLEIHGPGAGLLTIDGDARSRIFRIDSGATASIDGLTVSGGRPDPGSSPQVAGGGMYNSGNLVLKDVVIAGNSISGNGSSLWREITHVGGGVYSEGVLQMINVTVSGNSCSRDWAPYPGGGVRNSAGGVFNSGTMTLTNVTIANNVAGGISNAGSLAMSNVTITGNTGEQGGGLCNESGTTTMNHVTISENWAPGGGGIYNASGTVKMADAIISQNRASDGGGIWNAGAMTMTNATVYGNSALSTAGGVYTGGLYANGSSLAMCNVSVYGNSSKWDAGGLYHGSGDLLLTNVTIYGNVADWRGGGVSNPAGTGVFRNTVVARNQARTSSDIGGTFSPGSDYNLVGILDSNQAASIGANSICGTSDLPLDPGLGDLTSVNGLLVFPLVEGSPALNAGSNALAVDAQGQALSTDQAGNPRILDGTVDVGAVEGVLAPRPGVTYVVTSLEDTIAADGVLTFREAFLAANLNIPVGDAPGGSFTDQDRIIFAPGVCGSISAADGWLTIFGKLSIEGPGEDAITFQGDGKTRVFTIRAPADVQLSGMLITGGEGGVYNTGSLRMDHVVLSANTTLGDGGGLYNDHGDVVLDGVDVRGNTASDEWGAGLLNFGGTMTVRNAVITGNTTRGIGGGIHNQSGALSLFNATISGNTASGGGGLYNNGGAVTVGSASIYGNTARVGGGLYNSGTLTMSDVTVSGNTASDWGGGLRHSGRLTMSNVTVFGNTASSGGGLYVDSSSPTHIVTLNNTILAQNQATTGPDLYGTSTLSGDYNLIGVLDASQAGAMGVHGQAGSPGSPLDLKLGDLTNINGMLVLPLLPGSPAINAGSNDLAVDVEGNPLLTDAAGNPRVSGGTVDIGAFEYQTGPGPISGVVFEDLNANGVRDAGEPGLAGWTVYVDAHENGELDPGEVSILTDTSGAYRQDRLPGVYRLRAVPWAGWTPTFPDGGLSVTVTSEAGISGQDLGLLSPLRILRDINTQPAGSGTASSSPSLPVELNGTLLFSADDGIHGRGLWKSDGTAAGTTMLAAVNAWNLMPFNGKVFFFGDDGSSSKSLWVTDGTAEGTIRLAATLDRVSYNIGLHICQGKLLFASRDELWVSDGTVAGTAMVLKLPAEQGSITEISVFDDRAFFTTAAGGVWGSDLTAAGSELLCTVPQGPASETQLFSAGQGRVYIHSYAEIHHTESGPPPGEWYEGSLNVYVSDGTSEGTVRLLQNTVDPRLSFFNVNACNGILYFHNFDEAHGMELWRSDGTPDGTRLLRDMTPGPESLWYAGLVELTGNMTFPFDGGRWITDGSTEGTVRLGDCWPAMYTVVFNSTFYALGHEELGTCLWRSDGTPGGTSIIEYFLLRADAGHPFVVQGDSLLFALSDFNAARSQLWRTDGTAAGTELLVEVPSPIYDIVALSDGRIVVKAEDPAYGTELFFWVESEHQLPIANAGGPYLADADGTVTLSGSGSSDPAGAGLVFEWDLDYDGQQFSADANSPTVQLSGIAPLSTRTVALRVTDSHGRSSPIVTAQVFGRGQISGTLFEDLYGNGQRAFVAPRLSGRIVYIDANGNGQLDAGETSVTTEADGAYRFENLAPGSYTLRQVLPTDWITMANALTVNVASGQETSGQDLGSLRPGLISGFVYAENSGTQVPLAAWTLFLDVNRNGVLDSGEPSTITDAEGAYAFHDLLPGSYRVVEVVQGGWVASSTSGFDATLRSGFSWMFNFINQRQPAPVLTGSISGIVYQDQNGDGLMSGDETGLANQIVFLDSDNDGQWDASEPRTLTDASGQYRFENLPAGSYHLRAMSADAACISPACELSVVGGTELTPIRLGIPAGQKLEAPKGRILGRVFWDRNANRKLDRKDQLLGKWRVFLDADNDGVLDKGEVSVLTDARGRFAFKSLPIGNYAVRVASKRGFRPMLAKSARAIVKLRANQMAQSRDFGQRR